MWDWNHKRIVLTPDQDGSELNFLFTRSLVAQTVKNLPANAENMDSIPGLGRSPGEENGYPLQYSCLENSMDKGAWPAAVHGLQQVRQN